MVCRGGTLGVTLVFALVFILLSGCLNFLDNKQDSLKQETKLQYSNIFKFANFNGKLYASTGVIYYYDQYVWERDKLSPIGTGSVLVSYKNNLYTSTFNSMKKISSFFMFNGKRWVNKKDFKGVELLAASVYKGNLYLAGTGGSVYSFDGTSSKVVMRNNDLDVTSLAVYNGKLYAGTGQKGLIYEYDGNDWKIAYNTPDHYVSSFAVYKSKLYAGTSGSYGLVYVFDGFNWNLAYQSEGKAVNSLQVHNTKLYAAVSMQDGNTTLLSYDGTRWDKKSIINEKDIISMVSFRKVLYAGSGSTGKIYRLAE